LGLAICKQLIEMMDGRVGVDSQPDQGSRFWFTARFQGARMVEASPVAAVELAEKSV